MGVKSGKSYQLTGNKLTFLEFCSIGSVLIPVKSGSSAI